ncbi:MAG: hypothetical protein HY094_00335 [Candidatus Melainabacteria bacterium]|nr:hypothetical protein [Candidatus Melainabacteria bacterium]
MKFLLLILFLIVLITLGSRAFCDSEAFYVSPLCTTEGSLTCPDGFEAACADEKPGDTEPKCLFLETKYVPGCWKFIGIKHLDLSLFPTNNMPSSTMVKVTGGGEVFTLNREIIGCRKL